jgi:hypothetical protein
VGRTRAALIGAAVAVAALLLHDLAGDLGVVAALVALAVATVAVASHRLHVARPRTWGDAAQLLLRGRRNR